MRAIRLSKIGPPFAILIFLLSLSGASGKTAVVKTTKGYRLTILPVMGAEKVEREPRAPKGRVRVQSLRERVYGKSEEPKKHR